MRRPRGCDSLRGCGKVTSNVAWIVVGRGDSTMMRSAMWIGFLDVVRDQQHRVALFAEDAQQLVRMRRLISASSAENGSSM